MDAEQVRKEDCRHEVIGFLVERQSLAFDAAAIHRRLRRTSDFTLAEIEAAAVFLAGAGLLTTTRDRLGATQFHQATSVAVLAHERGEV